MQLKPYLSFLVLLLCGIAASSLMGQNLARKGSLGAMLGPITAEIQAQRGLENTKGTHLQQVIPASTAANLGLQAEDILLTINGKVIENTQQAVEMAQQFYANQAITVEVWRENKKLTLMGKVKGKPLETSSVAEVIYDAVPYANGMLRSIIHKPKADGHFPLVVYFQGFDCGSIDAYYDNSGPVRRFVDDFVERGFAVYRVEKPGVGDSNGALDCNTINYQQELDAFDAAMTDLKKYDFLDTDNIFYFGHSLGGITAPLLATKHQPKGVIVYGTVVKSWYEYMLEVHREQAMKRGDDFVQLEATSRAAAPLLAEFFLLKKTPTELMENPTYKSLMENGIMRFENDQFVGRHYTFWQELNEQNQVQAWKEAGVHTLALYGEYDLQAIGPEAAQVIADIVNTYHPGKGSYKIIPETEHAFAKVPSMEEYVNMLRDRSFNRQYMSTHFNGEIVEIIANWIVGLLRES
ncbi:MAG: alpha/beta hydrolase [Saprospiraceae bacterium]